jgi:ATP-dependent Clp protease ATP-binding subunit ClpA
VFERFSRQARDAVVATQVVARETGSRTIDTRHLLVALVEGGGRTPDALLGAGVDVEALRRSVRAGLSGSGLDAAALASLGIDLDAVREQAERVFGPGALDGGQRSSGHLRFLPDARKALELALREAIRAGDRRIDDGHLLLGILRAECPGRDAVLAAGVDLAAVRAAVAQGPGSRSA